MHTLKSTSLLKLSHTPTTECDFIADPSLLRFLHSNALFPQERSKVNFLTVEGTGSEEKPLKIPKEVWILVNHLYTKACDQVRFGSICPGRKMINGPSRFRMSRRRTCSRHQAYRRRCRTSLTLWTPASQTPSVSLVKGINIYTVYKYINDPAVGVAP